MTDDRGHETVTDGGAKSVPFAVSEGGGGTHEVGGVSESDRAGPSSEEKQPFLIEIARRAPLLRALRSGASTGTELSQSVEMSRSTVHRASSSLESYNLVTKTDGSYELTGLGRIIAEKVDTFGAEAWAAMALEPLLNTIDDVQFPIENFVDARITRPMARQPHMSISRIIELIEASDSLRMLSTVLSPIYVDVGYREMRDGMQIEAVFDQEAIEIMVTQYTEQALETIGMGNFTVFGHPGLPFELFIFDDMMGIAAHDESGVARVLVECDSPEAIEWAEEHYYAHRAEAVPLHL